MFINNSLLDLCSNFYFNNILEEELFARDVSIKYNKIEIHKLLLNKK